MNENTCDQLNENNQFPGFQFLEIKHGSNVTSVLLSGRISWGLGGT